MALMHVNFFSDVLGLSVSMDAIIPQETKTQIGMKGVAKNGLFQTLYLLHGMSDDHTIWQRRTSIERYASELGIAVIMPTTQLGWYTDMAHGLKWWSFISDELPSVCRQFFRLSPEREDNFAAGLSMGGYGALKLGLGCGEKFSHVASLSGGLDLMRHLDEGPQDFRSPTFWTDVFGSKDAYETGDDNLFVLSEKRAQKGSMPKIYQWCGTEDFCYAGNTALRDHLTKLGYDLTFEESPGDHQWKYWDEKIQRVLEWLPIKK